MFLVLNSQSDLPASESWCDLPGRMSDIPQEYEISLSCSEQGNHCIQDICNYLCTDEVETVFELNLEVGNSQSCIFAGKQYWEYIYSEIKDYKRKIFCYRRHRAFIWEWSQRTGSVLELSSTSERFQSGLLQGEEKGRHLNPWAGTRVIAPTDVHSLSTDWEEALQSGRMAWTTFPSEDVRVLEAKFENWTQTGNIQPQHRTDRRW